MCEFVVSGFGVIGCMQVIEILYIFGIVFVGLLLDEFEFVIVYIVVVVVCVVQLVFVQCFIDLFVGFEMCVMWVGGGFEFD